MCPLCLWLPGPLDPPRDTSGPHSGEARSHSRRGRCQSQEGSHQPTVQAQVFLKQQNV